MGWFLDPINLFLQEFVQLVIGLLQRIIGPVPTPSWAYETPTPRSSSHVLFPMLPTWQDHSLSAGLLVVIAAVFFLLTYGIPVVLMVVEASALLGFFDGPAPVKERFKRAGKKVARSLMAMGLMMIYFLAFAGFIGLLVYMFWLVFYASFEPQAAMELFVVVPAVVVLATLLITYVAKKRGSSIKAFLLMQRRDPTHLTW